MYVKIGSYQVRIIIDGINTYFTAQVPTLYNKFNGRKSNNK
jgi:hypothetical protein